MQEQDWLGIVVCEAIDFLAERRRVLEGRLKLLVLRKLVERGRAALHRGRPCSGAARTAFLEELKITRIFDPRSMPDDVFSMVLAFWHPPGSLPPRRYHW